MGRALQEWLNNHELPAIIAAVLGVVVTLALLLVVGGYFLVTP
jgi:redox-regulated HSP33 family molecular chaperone